MLYVVMTLCHSIMMRAEITLLLFGWVHFPTLALFPGGAQALSQVRARHPVWRGGGGVSVCMGVCVGVAGLGEQGGEEEDAHGLESDGGAVGDAPGEAG